ncbi:FecR family protein [Mangrovibacterium lignilyticum]|uniref:FecR family protein n=1 Tax=Mangrovibacterium lignilyticum TaxID=2668052 RepID=UPI0013D72E89|nr:FecR domain-containing protein [Mangrovibacterium lignilyticum]
MTKVKEHIRIAGLLARKMLGMLTDEQRVHLQKWEESDDNKKVAEDILQPRSFDDWNRQMDNLDVSGQWTTFLNRMQKTSVRRNVIRLKIIRTVTAVAAVLLLAVTVGIVWEKFSGSDQEQKLAELSIEPGSKNARLILDNGQVVDLKATDSQSIDEGSVIIKNDSGVLVYDDDMLADETTSKLATHYATNRLSIPRGGEYQLVLPDGSKVWLNSETELSYTVPFKDNERRVELKGEAYFEVAHDKSKPFIVATPSQTIQVLGTQFNVSAYTEDQSTVTTLVEGKVQVELDASLKSTDKIVLKPNEQLVLNTKTAVVELKEVDTSVYTAWKDGRFVFRNEPLESLLKKISRWYDVDINVDSSALQSIHFTGNLPKYKNMSGLIKILQAETSVTVVMEDNHTLTVTK